MANGNDNGNGSFFTLDDLKAINAAIVSGARSVHIGDRSVSYSSLAEMKEIRDMIAEDLGLARPSQPSVIRIAHNDGRGPAPRRFDVNGE